MQCLKSVVHLHLVRSIVDEVGVEKRIQGGSAIHEVTEHHSKTTSQRFHLGVEGEAQLLPSKWSIGSLLLVPVPTKIVTIPFASSLGFILAPICSQNLISCPCCSLNEISLLAKLGRCSISCETPARI